MPKYNAEFKEKIAKEYLSGEGSTRYLGMKYGVNARTVWDWAMKYKEQGITGFIPQLGCKCYSSKFKLKCVELYISGEMYVSEIVSKYNISDASILKRWIKCYNANRELKDYNPKREVYMAEARRKTTIEERKKIVEYCIKHNRDYKGTASIYDVSYSQVYSWIKKYDANGEEGLSDKRGHHKTDDQVDELERLRRENLRLKRQLEEKDMVVELLKKVKEFEGM
ncbi:MAG: helix-turn-helix domain-containing protein [Lachnospiraceae bacterium]